MYQSLSTKIKILFENIKKIYINYISNKLYSEAEEDMHIVFCSF